MVHYTNSFLPRQVYRGYSGGTFRAGPLHQVSVVGTVHEEVGGYFPHFLAMVETNPFLRLVSVLDVVVDLGPSSAREKPASRK